MLLALSACLMSATFIGCALFEKPFGQEPGLPVAEKTVSRNTIVLDIVVAARPRGDSLMKLLWDDVQEMGVVETTEQRRLLNANGFRLAVASSPVPSALQTILRESSARGSNRAPTWDTTTDQLPGSSQVTLFDGQDTLFEVSGLVPELTVSEVDLEGAEIEEPQTFRQARCVVRVTAERIQDGWIRLRFLPEIHHGANTNRLVGGGTGLQLRTTQRVWPMYHYQFEVTMRTGEIALVGPADVDDVRPGRQFLATEGPTGPTEKLITVRLAGTSSVRGESQGVPAAVR